MNSVVTNHPRESARPSIVVLDNYTLDPAGDNPWPQLSSAPELITYDRTFTDQFLERAESADILVTNKTGIGSDVLDRLPRLKFIAVMATGYNIVDVKAAKRRGIPVSNVPGYGTDTVAQYTLALVLELCHRVGEHAASVARGEWTSSVDWCYWKSPQIELRKLTLGIVGFGRIGQRFAELDHAFGMRIIYAARHPVNPVTFPATPVSIEMLFSQADILTLHCSPTESNYEFVNEALLRRMKRSSFLINTTRGQLINEIDLAESLKNGTLAGAALDVLSSEPPTAGNPLLGAPRCLITPHMAWATLAARKRIMDTTVSNIEAPLRGEPFNVVNP